MWHRSIAGADVEITVRDKKSGQPMPCRIHLKDSAGKPQQPGDLPFWFDHFVSPGTAKLQLNPGKYTVEIERGPEYRRIAGTIEVKAQRRLRLEYQLERIADLAAEGWWSGELHVHRPVEAIELLMRAEDLHVAPVITWWNKQNLWDNRRRPVDPLVQLRRQPVLSRDGRRRRTRRGRPALLSSQGAPGDRVDQSGISVAHEVRRSSSAQGRQGLDRHREAVLVGRSRLARHRQDEVDRAGEQPYVPQPDVSKTKPGVSRGRWSRLPAPLGNGYWTQEIYYHVLNAGLRVPPSAGSASGVLPNPVGYNRVYVHLDKELTYADWWNGLRAGRSFVTNGPLLRVRANGEFPGHVFAAAPGTEIKVDLKAELTTQDPIRVVEIIKNGQVERRVPFEEVVKTHSLGTIEIQGERLVPGPSDRRESEDLPLRVDRAFLCGNRRREAAHQQGVGSVLPGLDARADGSCQARRSAARCWRTTFWPRNSGKNALRTRTRISSDKTPCRCLPAGRSSPSGELPRQTLRGGFGEARRPRRDLFVFRVGTLGQDLLELR